jgi:hypothetical protein
MADEVIILNGAPCPRWRASPVLRDLAAAAPPKRNSEGALLLRVAQLEGLPDGLLHAVLGDRDDLMSWVFQQREWAPALREAAAAALFLDASAAADRFPSGTPRQESIRPREPAKRARASAPDAEGAEARLRAGFLRFANARALAKYGMPLLEEGQIAEDGVADACLELQRLERTYEACKGRVQDIWYDFDRVGVVRGALTSDLLSVDTSRLLADRSRWERDGELRFQATRSPNFYARATLTPAGAARLRLLRELVCEEDARDAPRDRSLGSCDSCYRDARACWRLDKDGVHALVRVRSRSSRDFWVETTVKLPMSRRARSA